MSRSDRMPTTRRSAPVTTSAPMLSLGQPLGGRRQIGVGLDGDNLAALGGQNGFDGHWSLPWVAPVPSTLPIFDDLEVARDDFNASG